MDLSGFGRHERDRGARPASSLQRMRSISTTNYTHGRHGGHAPGHICDAFIAAIDAFEAWKDGEPEPTVEHEVHNQPVEITISQACGLVWNCSDILPNLVVRQLEDCDVTLTRVTCAAGARACASGSRSFCLRGPLSGNRPFRLCGFRRLGLGRQPRADLGEIGWCERPSSRCERGPALDAQHSARWTATLPAALHSSHKSVESGETRKIVPHLAHCRCASECAGSVTARRGVDCAFVRLRIAQWRLALARQESQINPGHLEADNSRSHAEHRMAGSLYGSRIARQLDPGGTLRAVRPFVKGSA